MGFFTEGEIFGAGKSRAAGVPTLKLLHELECRACPLNNAKVDHPKIPPTGSETPIIYVLGEAPGKDEDKQNRQFVGQSGQYLRANIPAEWVPHIRWNNVIRTRPPENRDPEYIEIECCRPALVRDIERTKPKVIFGFGEIALNWATGQHGIGKWRGRRVPVKIGSHTCWFYFFHHPAFLLYAKKANDGKYTENERMFVFDLKRAFAEIDKLPPAEVHTKARALADVKVVFGRDSADADTVVNFLEWAGQQSYAGVDVETNRKRPYNAGARILTAAVSTCGSTLAFPLAHRDAWPNEADRVRVYTAFLEFLCSSCRKVIHNASFEEEWVGVVFGREFVRAGLWECTMSQAFILDQRPGDKRRNDDENSMECYSLAFLTLLYFGVDVKTWSHLDRTDMENEKLEDILPYNGLDALYHLWLFTVQQKRIREEKLDKVYTLHMDRVPACVLTQIKGVPLNPTVTHELDGKYTARIASLGKAIAADPLAKEFYRRTGKTFKPGSDDHLVILLRDILKRKEGERYAKGTKEVIAYQVNEDTLSRVPLPLMKLVLDWKSATKVSSTYLFRPGSEIVYEDGMLHPIINTCGARSGRVSSQEPNEQNWPKRDDEQKEIRRQIEAPPGYLIIAADQGQGEARVFGMASKDATYCKMLWENYDVHMDWAQRITKSYPRVLTVDRNIKWWRQHCKSNWVFASFFGAQLPTISLRMGIPTEVLEPHFKEFWRIFTGIKDWHERCLKFYREHGYVELLTGRRRCGPLSPNAAINTPIQGTLGEINCDVHSRVSKLDIWDLQPILNVHDDLTYIIPEDKVEEYTEKLVAEMIRITFPFINVPLVAEVSIGQNLFEMEEIGKFSSVDWYGKAAHHG